MFTNVLYTSNMSIYKGIVIHAAIMQEYNVENPILILPNGDIQYYETIIFTLRKNKQLVVILEKGGQNCHLLVNSREKNNITILHLPNALSILKDKTYMSINCKTGNCEVLIKNY